MAPKCFAEQITRSWRRAACCVPSPICQWHAFISTQHECFLATAGSCWCLSAMLFLVLQAGAGICEGFHLRRLPHRVSASQQLRLLSWPGKAVWCHLTFLPPSSLSPLFDFLFLMACALRWIFYFLFSWTLVGLSIHFAAVLLKSSF